MNTALHAVPDVNLQVKPLLHPDAVVYFFRHGHAAPAKKDIERVLSDKGINQADQLGRVLASLPVGIDIDYVVCSAAPRAQQTGHGAARHFDTVKAGLQWHNGVNRQFYSLYGNDDHEAFLKLSDEVGSISYSAHKAADKNGLLEKLGAEFRENLLTLPDIDKAKRIVIFNHAVTSNAAATALFPQHAETIASIDMAPCDCIRLTATTCEHVRLLT